MTNTILLQNLYEEYVEISVWPKSHLKRGFMTDTTANHQRALRITQLHCWESSHIILDSISQLVSTIKLDLVISLKSAVGLEMIESSRSGGILFFYSRK